jgi:hypothetical protein
MAAAWSDEEDDEEATPGEARAEAEAATEAANQARREAVVVRARREAVEQKVPTVTLQSPACSDYRVDLVGAAFGVCKCGLTKAEHDSRLLGREAPRCMTRKQEKDLIKEMESLSSARKMLTKVGAAKDKFTGNKEASASLGDLIGEVNIELKAINTSTVKEPMMCVPTLALSSSALQTAACADYQLDRIGASSGVCK